MDKQKINKEELSREIEYFFSRNSDKLITPYNKNSFIRSKKFVGHVYTLKTKEFNFQSVLRMISFITSINDHFPNQKMPILFDISQTEPADKLSINLMEIVAYHVLFNLKQKMYILYSFKRNIITEQMGNSAFTHLGLDNYSKEDFGKKFLGFNKGPRFREIIQKSDHFDKNLSKIQLDFMVFCQMFGIVETVARHIGKLIAELVDNAVIHANSSVIIDVDINNGFSSLMTGDQVEGVNITVLNLSEILFYDGVKEKLNVFRSNRNNFKDTQLFSTYDNINHTYSNHKKFFSETYTENHFWSIAALQHHVSGRENRFDTNGVGLTKLIRLIQQFSDDDYSYIVSGATGIWFKKHLMEYNDSQHKVLGFNIEKNFLNYPPSAETLGQAPIYIPGTFLNLSFAINAELKEKQNE